MVQVTINKVSNRLRVLGPPRTPPEPDSRGRLDRYLWRRRPRTGSEVRRVGIGAGAAGPGWRRGSESVTVAPGGPPRRAPRSRQWRSLGGGLAAAAAGNVDTGVGGPGGNSDGDYRWTDVLTGAAGPKSDSETTRAAAGTVGRSRRPGRHAAWARRGPGQRRGGPGALSPVRRWQGPAAAVAGRIRKGRESSESSSVGTVTAREPLAGQPRALQVLGQVST